MSWQFFIISLVFASQLANAATILIVTDDPTGKQANLIKDLMLKTPPFSLMDDLNIKIEKIDQLQCQVNGDTSDNRDIHCSQGFLAGVEKMLDHLTGARSADRTILVSKQNIFGGSCLKGNFEVTVASGMPPSTAIHELLHSFNFRDEYALVAGKQADLFCNGLAETGPNLAVFNDNPPYSSDGAARQMHAQQIPWYDLIKPQTEITSDHQLGTPQKNVTGLYKGHLCDNSKDGRPKSWQPGTQISIMQDLNSTYIPEETWGEIANALGTKIRLRGMELRSTLDSSSTQKSSQ